VARNLHDDAVRDPLPAHVGHEAMPEVMKAEVLDPRPGARPLEARAGVAFDRLAKVGKDVSSGPLHPSQQVIENRTDGYSPAPAGLGLRTIKDDEAFAEIHPVPGKVQNLALPHPRLPGRD